MPEKLEPKKKGKNTGSGGKHSRPDIDWDLAEQFYIQGEIIRERGKKADLVRKEVSMTDVAAKFNCTLSLVHYYAKKRKWREKRADYKAMAQRELNKAVAKARAMSFTEASGILDAWLMKFSQQVASDNVRTDSLADFNIAMRLKSFIEQQPDPGANPESAVSIDRLQRRHAKVRKAQLDAEDAATAGVLGDESIH